MRSSEIVNRIIKIKIYFFIALLFNTTIVTAQIRSFGFYVAPTVNYRTLADNLNYLKKFNSKVNLFNAGFFYSRSISSKFIFTTGIDYSIEGFNIKPLTYYSTQATFSTKTRLGYVGFPLIIEMKVLQIKKFKISIAPGIINKFLVLAHYTPYNFIVLPFFNSNQFPKPTEIRLSNNDLNQLKYNRYMPELVGTLAFSYTSKNITIGMAPEIRYSILSTTKEANYFHTYPEHLYSYGIKFFISKNCKN